MGQEVESVIADAAPPVLGVLRPGVILIVIPEPYPYGMVLVINIPGIADPQDLPDPEPGLRDQEEQEPVPVVCAGFQDRHDLILLRSTDISFFRFQIAVKGLCPHDPLYTDRVGHCDLPVRQDPQAPKLRIFRLHKKIEPEHVFQIRVTGSIPGVFYVIFSFMPACLDPVEEPHKVFMLLVIGQLADLGKFHLLFREVFQVITQGESRPFYCVW